MNGGLCMISLENINKKFDEKIIFENASFEAKRNQLTIIKGKSGIGKSTLIKALLFDYKSEYKFDGRIVVGDDNVQTFVRNNIGIVYQEPLFIDDLTVIEHINFIKDIYKLNNIRDDLIKLLNISSVMNKYPNQLSGGEKMRVSIYLVTLRQPRIFILDEPTASLDSASKDLIISFLKEYAMLGNIVIATSHDQELIQNGDVIYNIENRKLNIVKQNTPNNNKQYDFDRPNLNAPTKMLSIYLSTRKHHVFVKSFLTILLSACIAFVFISISLNNVIISNTKNYLNNFSSNELIVYNSLFKNNKYSFEGVEYPIQDKIINQIKKIDGVEKVIARYDLSNSEVYGYGNGKNGESVISDGMIKSYDEGMLKESNFNNNLFFHSYIEEHDYTKEIKKTYSNTGVYVSKNVFDELFPNEDVIKPYIEFDLPIPFYNSDGISEISENDHEDNVAPCNTVTCTYKTVRLPVRGIINNAVLGQEDASFPNHIYISNEYIDSLIETEKAEDRIVYASTIEDKYYINTKPADFNYDNYQIINQNTWKPNGYTVVVNDLTKMDKIIDSIKKTGVAVDSQYFDANSILEVKEGTKNMLITISVVLISLVLGAYFVIQYIKHESMLKSNKFLKSFGFNNYEVRKYNRILNFFGSIELFIISIMLYFITRFVLEKSMIAFIKIDFKIIIGIFIFTLLIEYIYKMFLLRVIRHD